jgi:hypothetical protein
MKYLYMDVAKIRPRAALDISRPCGPGEILVKLLNLYILDCVKYFQPGLFVKFMADVV